MPGPHGHFCSQLGPHGIRRGSFPVKQQGAGQTEGKVHNKDSHVRHSNTKDFSMAMKESGPTEKKATSLQSQCYPQQVMIFYRHLTLPRTGSRTVLLAGEKGNNQDNSLSERTSQQSRNNLKKKYACTQENISESFLFKNNTCVTAEKKNKMGLISLAGKRLVIPWRENALAWPTSFL